MAFGFLKTFKDAKRCYSIEKVDELKGDSCYTLLKRKPKLIQVGPDNVCFRDAIVVMLKVLFS